MKIAVRYYSQTGNTKRLAEAIAEKAGVEAMDCSNPVDEHTDLLFLGGSVYAFGLDEVTKKYIGKLDAMAVKNVAVFGTSAIVKSGNDEMTKLIEKRNISVLKDQFYCRGQFKFMHKGRPNSQDLQAASDFAAAAINSL